MSVFKTTPCPKCGKVDTITYIGAGPIKFDFMQCGVCQVWLMFDSDMTRMIPTSEHVEYKRYVAATQGRYKLMNSNIK